MFLIFKIFFKALKEKKISLSTVYEKKSEDGIRTTGTQSKIVVNNCNYELKSNSKQLYSKNNFERASVNFLV